MKKHDFVKVVTKCDVIFQGEAAPVIRELQKEFKDDFIIRVQGPNVIFKDSMIQYVFEVMQFLPGGKRDYKHYVKGLAILIEITQRDWAYGVLKNIIKRKIAKAQVQLRECLKEE